jgi:uncharacterized protein
MSKKPVSVTNTSRLVKYLRAHFQLDWDGVHGAPHWARVKRIGLKLAAVTSAEPEVVSLFAFLHDSCRINDRRDPEHGQRAASLVQRLQGDLFQLAPEQLDQLIVACAGHSSGQLIGDVTVQTCWDADRLDYGRLGVRPNPQYLGNEAARSCEFLEWAWDLSQGYALFEPGDIDGKS